MLNLNWSTIDNLRARIQQLEWENEIAEKALDEAYAKIDAIRLCIRNVVDTPTIKLCEIDRIIG